MLNSSEQLLQLINNILQEIPDSVKIGNNYGLLNAILAEYYIVKINAEIDEYVQSNLILIREKCNAKEPEDVFDHCRGVLGANGQNVFLFEEISSIQQIKNLRNQSSAHTASININHINMEQVRLLFLNARSFIEKFDSYIKG